MKNNNIFIIIGAFIVAICATVATTVYFVKATNKSVEMSAPVNQTMVTPTPTPAQVPAVPAPVSVPAPEPVAVNATTPTPPLAVIAAPVVEEMAQIVSIKPHMITTRVPYTSCYKKRRVIEIRHHHNNEPPIAGTIIGGAAGGVIGHQFGGGRGQDVATVVGAIGGALAGASIQQDMNRPQPEYRVVYDTVCETKHKTTQKQKGYEVTYLYKGVQGVRILSTQPIGTQIPLTVLQAAPALGD